MEGRNPKGRTVVKLCLLGDWTEEEVCDFIPCNDVPYDQFEERHHEECGIHIKGSGI